MSHWSSSPDHLSDERGLGIAVQGCGTHGLQRKRSSDCTGLAMECLKKEPRVGGSRCLGDFRRNKCGAIEEPGDKKGPLHFNSC